MLAPNNSASSIASFAASREYSDMSNGTKILLVTIVLQPRKKCHAFEGTFLRCHYHFVQVYY
jgi:hypothetical protein